MGFGGPRRGFGGPTGSLVPIMVSLWGLVALQGFWWPYKISGTHSDVFIGFDGHYGVLMGFGGPTGVLVALQDLWCPLWCPYGVWWPYRGFGGPKGSLVPMMVSLWGLVALQGDLVGTVVSLWGLMAPKELWQALWCPYGV